MRVLLVLWDGGGNVPPQLGIARELVHRGHSVRVLGHAGLRAQVEETGAEFVGYRHAPDADASRPETDLVRDWQARTPLGGFARTRDNLIFGPAAAFARDVVAELKRERADAVAFDYLLAGAAVGAEAAGVPACALVHTVYPFPAPGVPPFGLGLPPARGPLGRARDGVLRRLSERAYRPGLRPLNAARVEFGLSPLADPLEVLGRLDRALVLTAPEFDFAGSAALPPNVRHVGPVLAPARRTGWHSPWPAGHPDPLVLASFSTTYQNQRGLAARTLLALADLPVRGLLTTGPALDLAGLEVPPHVVVRDFVPHAAVLPEASAVVTHAGLGTVHAALAAGVPLVCLPHGRDQNDNAARVVHAGAGVRLGRGADPRRLRRAIATVLDDRGMRAAAGRLGSALRAQDGATRAADELESVACGRPL